MKIYVNFTWYRDFSIKDIEINSFNGYTGTSRVFLEAEKATKSAVIAAIRDYVAGWSGSGYVLVSSVATAFANDFHACEIKQKKFVFRNI